MAAAADRGESSPAEGVRVSGAWNRRDRRARVAAHAAHWRRVYRVGSRGRSRHFRASDSRGDLSAPTDPPHGSHVAGNCALC